MNRLPHKNFLAVATATRSAQAQTVSTATRVEYLTPEEVYAIADASI